MKKSTSHSLKKHYEEAHICTVVIVPHLNRYHRDSILNFFSPLEKEVIRYTTGDPETRETVLPKESIDGNILQENLEDWLLNNIL